MVKEEVEKNKKKAEEKNEPVGKKVLKEKKFEKRGQGFKKFNPVEKRTEQEEKKIVFVKKQTPFSDYKMFDKWATKDVVVTDMSLMKYINLDPVIIPHSFGRKSQTKFGKTNINIVERLINKGMRSGQGKRKLSGKYIRGRNGCGKKLQVMQIVENAFEIIENKAKKNPIQVLIDAIENSAPREDVTRVKRGGIAYSIAVDVSPMKRLDEALKNIALAGFGNSFNNKTDAANALAEEIINAANRDNKSIAIKRRDEVERIAKASR